MTRRKLAVAIGLIVAAILAIVPLTPGGKLLAERLVENLRCCQLSIPRAVVIAAQEARGEKVYPSQLGQDKWVAEVMFPAVTDGYFVDVGSGDGKMLSNTKALEERGWRGICIDPFPTGMDGRTCQMMKEVVFSESGKLVKFHPDHWLGGIADTLGAWKSEASKKEPVELTTVTLAELLARGQAPAFIHFLSIDIEGAELEALRGLPFDQYRFGAMAIEHNYEEPKRTSIIAFLNERGYRRVHTFRTDDFFAPVTTVH